ncbi:MAG TPA: J domain-containing protein [Candidatus Elarobacter sp.]|nr:J domain-containing protein [Candidatus Elarobacter sp.]
MATQQAPNARAFLRRLHPWIGKAVHARWTVRRSFYQSEVDALLMALDAEPGRMPPELSLRLQGLLGRLYREWFPRTWRRNPTYAEVVGDFRWWLGVAERWSEPPAKPGRRRRATYEPRADQPKRLLRLLGLPHECTAGEFMASWRRFLKAHHPDLNPDQTPDERRHFAEAVALWRR